MIEIDSFVKKTSIFIMLIFVFLAPPLLILNMSGELFTLNQIISSQKKHKNSLFGAIYSNSDTEYKLKNTLIRRPKLLAIGTSRVMQFKNFFFRDTFYNAGETGKSKIEHFEKYIDKLAENGYSPEILIIGLDQFFFNSNAKMSTSGEYQTRINNDQELNALSLTKYVYKDLIAGKLNLIQILNTNNNIGVNAITNNTGFMYDGSYYYGKIYSLNKDSEDYKFENTKNRIKNGDFPFEYSNEIDPSSLSELKSLLKKCQKNHIKVVAFLPPFAPTIYKTMEKSQKYKYLSLLPKLIKRIASDYQTEFYDFTFFRTTSDKEYINGFHGSEVVYLKMLTEMAKNDNILSREVDMKNINLLEKNKISDLLLK